MPLEVEEIQTPDAIGQELRVAWDRMAVAQSMPSCLSAWMLAAHENVPGGTRLRVLVARSEGTVVGILPLEIIPWPGPAKVAEYRLLASLLSHRVSPLYEPGREEELAAAFAARLGAELGGGAAFLQLEWLDGLSPWPELLRRHWPRRVAFRRDATLVTPLVRLDPDGDDERFRAGYSKNFRKSLRRAHREMTLRGGVVRRTEDPARLAADVRALFALHRQRFAAKGEKSSIDAGHEQAVLAAAPELLAGGHLRLWIVEAAETVVAADLHLRAGERMFAWNGGIDPAWEHESLGLILLDAAVRDAHALGVSVLDLGPGETDFKGRVAKASASVVSRSVWPLGAGLPLARARLGPKHARMHAGRLAARLPSEQRARIKRMLGDRL